MWDLLWIFYRFMEPSVMSKDWKEACIVPICNGKGDRREFTNYKEISTLSIPEKIYGSILISRVMEKTQEK